MSNNYVMVPVRTETKDKLKLLKSELKVKNADALINILINNYESTKNGVR